MPTINDTLNTWVEEIQTKFKSNNLIKISVYRTFFNQVMTAIYELRDNQSSPDASDVSYDNSVTEIAATDVQAAIDILMGQGANSGGLIFVYNASNNRLTLQNTDGDIITYITKNQIEKLLGNSIPKRIMIEGNSFTYLPTFSNNTNQVLEGDLALNGWINNRLLGLRLSYKGTGDINSVENWDIHEDVKYTTDQ